MTTRANLALMLGALVSGGGGVVTGAEVKLVGTSTHGGTRRRYLPKRSRYSVGACKCGNLSISTDVHENGYTCIECHCGAFVGAPTMLEAIAMWNFARSKPRFIDHAKLRKARRRAKRMQS